MIAPDEITFDYIKEKIFPQGDEFDASVKKWKQ